MTTRPMELIAATFRIPFEQSGLYLRRQPLKPARLPAGPAGFRFVGSVLRRSAWNLPGTGYLPCHPPGFRLAGKVSWDITALHTTAKLRYTNLIENTYPLPRRDKLDAFRAVYDPELVGMLQSHKRLARGLVPRAT